MRYSPDSSNIVPNLASRFDVSNDDKTFTFYLRERVRWSDGQEFSAEDFTWWYKNIANAENVMGHGPPWWLTVAGEFVAGVRGRVYGALPLSRTV